LAGRFSQQLLTLTSAAFDGRIQLPGKNYAFLATPLAVNEVQLLYMKNSYLFKKNFDMKSEDDIRFRVK
jgi:hypothetical protein